MKKMVEEIVADTKSIDEALDKVLKTIKEDLNTPKKKRKRRFTRKKRDVRGDMAQ